MCQMNSEIKLLLKVTPMVVIRIDIGRHDDAVRELSASKIVLRSLTFGCSAELDEHL